MTNELLYRGSLAAAIALMLFFAFSFFFGRLPKGAAFVNYNKARHRLGMALLVLAANYSVHLFWAPRFCYPEWAIMMNICTYFIAAWLFGSSMLQLLSKNYNSPRRDLTNIVAWLTFCATAIVAMSLTPRGTTMYVALCVFSIVFMLYTIRLATDLIRTYRRAIRLLDDYYSDDTKAYVRWMSVFTWLAVFYGVGQGLFTFIPDRYVFLWILSSIPFYT